MWICNVVEQVVQILLLQDSVSALAVTIARKHEYGITIEATRRWADHPKRLDPTHTQP